MILALTFLACQAPTALLRFVDVVTDEELKVHAPASTAIRDVRVERTEVNTIRISTYELPGKSDGASWVLTLDLSSDFENAGLVVLPVGSPTFIPRHGKAEANVMLFFRSEKKFEKINYSKSGSDYLIQMPRDVKFDEWYAVSLWRPAELAERFSPSSIWYSIVSAKTNSTAVQSVIPTVPEFMNDFPLQNAPKRIPPKNPSPSSSE